MKDATFNANAGRYFDRVIRWIAHGKSVAIQGEDLRACIHVVQIAPDLRDAPTAEILSGGHGSVFMIVHERPSLRGNGMHLQEQTV